MENFNFNNKKSIIIDTIGGLGNRLVPIFSLYRLCKIYNIKLYVIWEKYVTNTKFGVMIDCNVHLNNFLTNDDVKIIKKEEINNFKNIYFYEFHKNYNNIDLSLLNKYDTLLIKNRFHIFGKSNENIKNWIPMTKEEKMYKKDNLLLDLEKYINNFKFENSILNKVKTKEKKFKKNTLGVHIRGSDDHKDIFYRDKERDTYNTSKNDIEHFFEFCNNYLKKEDSCIFLMTPYKEIEDVMREKYKDKIIVNEKKNSNMINNRGNEEGIKNAFVDLILFSKCETIIGTAGSSYSFLGWLLSNNINYHIFF